MCTSITVFENTGFIRKNISKCPWQEYKWFLKWRGPIPSVMSGRDVAYNPLAILSIFWDSDHFILFSRGFCASQVGPGAYWYQGVFLTQRSVNPASVRILIEAASASRTVSFTDCMRFCALWTSISVACKERETLCYPLSLMRPFLQNQPKLGVDCSHPTCSWHPRTCHITGGLGGSTKKNPKKDIHDYDYTHSRPLAHTLSWSSDKLLPGALAVPSTWNAFPSRLSPHLHQIFAQMSLWWGIPWSPYFKSQTPSQVTAFLILQFFIFLHRTHHYYWYALCKFYLVCISFHFI